MEEYKIYYSYYNELSYDIEDGFMVVKEKSANEALKLFKVNNEDLLKRAMFSIDDICKL